MSDWPPELYDLRRQVSRLRLDVLILLGCALLFLALTNLALIALAPNFELVFEEMLGSKDRLPALTRLMLDYAKWFGGFVPYGVVVGLPSLCFVLVLVFQRSIYPMLLTLAVMLLMIIHAPLMIVALFLPLIQITTAMGERAS